MLKKKHHRLCPAIPPTYLPSRLWCGAIIDGESIRHKGLPFDELRRAKHHTMYRIALNRMSGVVHGHPYPRDCPVPLAKVGKELQGTGRQGSNPREYGQGRRGKRPSKSGKERRDLCKLLRHKGRREVRDGDERQYGRSFIASMSGTDVKR